MVEIGQGKPGSQGKVREIIFTGKNQGYFQNGQGKPGKVRENNLVREICS